MTPEIHRPALGKVQEMCADTTAPEIGMHP